MRRSRNNAFYLWFVVCLVVVSIPVKNLAYVVPLLYVAMRVRDRDGGFGLRLATLVGLVLATSTLSLLVDAFRGQIVNIPGMLLAVVTYLPMFIVLAERLDEGIDDDTLRKLAALCSWFVLVQSLVGVGQFVISRNPDAVCGTFGLLDFRQGGITITQVYFTFTIFGMLLFLAVAPYRPLHGAALVSGALICALAQSGHQTIFFVASLAALGATRVMRPRLAILSVGIAAAMFFALTVFYPETIELTADWYAKVAQDPESPKRMALEGGVEILRDGKNFLLGTGIGQFSSRAALITSGDYLSVSLPGSITGQSEYYSATIVPANEVFQEVGEGSAISKPYASLLSLIVELGTVGFSILLVVVIAACVRNLAWMRCADSRVSRIGFVANVGIVFFALCATIENYAEFPQAIFIPVLLYVAVESHAQMRLAKLATSPAWAASHPADVASLRSSMTFESPSPNHSP